MIKATAKTVPMPKTTATANAIPAAVANPMTTETLTTPGNAKPLLPTPGLTTNGQKKKRVEVHRAPRPPNPKHKRGAGKPTPDLPALPPTPPSRRRRRRHNAGAADVVAGAATRTPTAKSPGLRGSPPRGTPKTIQAYIFPHQQYPSYIFFAHPFPTGWCCISCFFNLTFAPQCT